LLGRSFVSTTASQAQSKGNSWTADWISADTALFVLRAVSGLDVVTGKSPHHAEDGAEATPVSSPRPSSAAHPEKVRL
jgi:hypothetical protein